MGKQLITANSACNITVSCSQFSPHKSIVFKKRGRLFLHLLPRRASSQRFRPHLAEFECRIRTSGHSIWTVRVVIGRTLVLRRINISERAGRGWKSFDTETYRFSSGGSLTCSLTLTLPVSGAQSRTGQRQQSHRFYAAQLIPHYQQSRDVGASSAPSLREFASRMSRSHTESVTATVHERVRDSKVVRRVPVR